MMPESNWHASIRQLTLDMTLANNHILDMGERGLLETLNCCKDTGIKTVGAGRNINGPITKKKAKRCKVLINIQILVLAD